MRCPRRTLAHDDRSRAPTGRGEQVRCWRCHAKRRWPELCHKAVVIRRENR